MHKSGKGDLYVDMVQYELLTKSLRPLPEKFHGLTDQGLANMEEWKKMFEEADVKLVEVKKDFPFRLVEYVIQF